MTDETGTTIEMPLYNCHKQVRALKIEEICPPLTEGLQGARLAIVDAGFAPVTVSDEYMKKHSPQAGGYYVVYEDGYQSYSPAKAFEEGYTRA